MRTWRLLLSVVLCCVMTFVVVGCGGDDGGGGGGGDPRCTEICNLLGPCLDETDTCLSDCNGSDESTIDCVNTDCGEAEDCDAAFACLANCGVDVN